MTDPHADHHNDGPHHITVAPMTIARFGFVLGLALSIAGNVADARHSVLAMVFGGVWPLLLMIAFEILVRTAWPTGRGWRWPPIGGLVLVAGVAAFMSYRHLMSLLGRIGEDQWGAAAGPIAFDGIMIVAAWAMLAMSRPRQLEVPAPTPQKRAAETQRKPRKTTARPKTPARPRPAATIGLASVPAAPETLELPEWATRAADTLMADHGKINGHLWQKIVRDQGGTCSNPTRERLWPAVKIHIEQTRERSA